MFIIVDIDGTIADCRHRLHFIKGENKDWDSFFKACKDDKPIQDVLDIINNLALDYNLLFITGRSDVCKGETKHWLGEKIMVNGYTLLMRKQGDFRPDDEVKPELLNNFLEESKLNKDVIQMVFEDRNSMVKKWREMGLTVAQVAEGDF